MVQATREEVGRVAFEIGRIARFELGYVGEGESRVIEVDVSEW